MTSEQAKDIGEFFASLAERVSTGLDLTTIRDILEKVHFAGREAEGVTYAEVDAGGVPAMWRIPAGCDAGLVSLHIHGGGGVVFSMHCRPKSRRAYRKGCRSSRPRTGLPAFTRTQVPRSNRRCGKSV